jgi:hypothetical protein
MSRRQAGGVWWLRWVAANAGAELVGLGGSALLWAVGLLYWNDRLGVIPGAILVVVGATLLEGTAVGVAQWAVLRSRLPRLTLASWWIATGLGALVAWTLGMIPSTMMDLTSGANGAPPFEMSDALQGVLAAGMGFVLGPILGLPQWRVLRRHVATAGWWIPANALAWAAGMPLVFAGVGWAIDAPSLPLAVVWVAVALLLAGAAVGAIHGLFLVWLFNRRVGNPYALSSGTRSGDGGDSGYFLVTDCSGRSVREMALEGRDAVPDSSGGFGDSGGSDDGGGDDGGGDGGGGDGGAE